MGTQDSMSGARTGTRRAGRWWALAGAGLLVAAVTLYATGTSRAIAVWIAPLTLLLLGVGVAGLATGWAPPRWLRLVVVVVVVTLGALGAWALAFTLSHPPMSV
jgi:hypothetical protein